jgi:hypothetical protein
VRAGNAPRLLLAASGRQAGQPQPVAQVIPA